MPWKGINDLSPSPRSCVGPSTNDETIARQTNSGAAQPTRNVPPSLKRATGERLSPLFPEECCRRDGREREGGLSGEPCESEQDSRESRRALRTTVEDQRRDGNKAKREGLRQITEDREDKSRIEPIEEGEPR